MPIRTARDRRALFAALAACLTVAIAGCSGSASSPATTSPGASHTSGAGTPADPATRRAVTQAYAALFGTKATMAQSLAALQHGDAFKQTILSQSKSPRAKHSGATVTAVRLLRPDLAAVHFTITDNGKPLFPTTGKAVRVGGHWQVAAQTFCGLLNLAGNAPKACKDASLTSLPH